MLDCFILRGVLRAAAPGVPLRSSRSQEGEIDLASSTCRVDFDLVSDPGGDGEVFVDAIRTVPSAGRTPWWKRNARWSTLTAYRFADLTLGNAPDERGVSGSSIGVRPSRRVRWSGRPRGEPRRGRACHVSLWPVDHRRLRSGAVPVGQSPVDRLERILEGRSRRYEAKPTSYRAASPARGRHRSRPAGPRLTFIVLAGGAFTMTLVGLVVPGVPTVPFLLATSYYLARSSPSLNERLRRTAFFWPILREWEGHAALSLTSRASYRADRHDRRRDGGPCPLTPVALSMILVVSSLSVYGVTQNAGRHPT